MEPTTPAMDHPMTLLDAGTGVLALFCFSGVPRAIRCSPASAGITLTLSGSCCVDCY